VDAGTLTVSQLAAGIDAALASWFAGEIWVQGEISSLKRSSAGHVYFQLVERETGQARADASIDVALFDAARRYVNSQLTAAGGVRMTDGMQVRIRGRLELYAPQGRVQLRMSGIDPAFTLALLLTERERVLGVLAADGLLDVNRQLPLTMVPLRVGLVTSDGSAAMADFVDELRTSGFAWRLTAVHVPVQGRGADEVIARALDSLHGRDIDVIAVVRGGGSSQDLATFDSEQIGRAIARARVPVLTGIGHEIDVSVADLVAHTSFKTPTACAAALVTRVSDGHEGAERAWRAIRDAAALVTHVAERDLHETAARAARLTRTRLDDSSRRAEDTWCDVLDISDRRLAEARTTLVTFTRELARRPRHGLDLADRELSIATATIRGADPTRLMERGWSITRTSAGSVVRDVAQLVKGERLRTTLASGTVDSTVTSTHTEREDAGTDGS
jgi:exodeoxyribonuclease VII large subunit